MKRRELTDGLTIKDILISLIKWQNNMLYKLNEIAMEMYEETFIHCNEKEQESVKYYDPTVIR